MAEPLLGPPMDPSAEELKRLCRAVADNWDETAQGAGMGDPRIENAVNQVLRLCANQLRDAIGDPRK